MLKKVLHGLLVFCLFTVSAIQAEAQTFTQKIQRSSQGEGQLTIHHDASIDALVNKVARRQTTPAPAAGSNGTPKAGQLPSKPTTPSAPSNPSAVPTTPSSPALDSIDNANRVVRGVVKAVGYRVQVYAGGNTRVDHQKALQAKENLKASFPNEPIYVHMYPPRWVCRMGNYRTYEEAHQMLVEVKRLGFKSATIIKGKVTLPQY